MNAATPAMTSFQRQAHDAALTSNVAVGFLANAAVRDAAALARRGEFGKARYVLTRAGISISRLAGERFECSEEYLAGLERAGLGQP